MRRTIDIVDTRRHTSLRIDPVDDTTAEVSLRARDDLVAKQTLDFRARDYRELQGFAEEIAKEWKGWHGSKLWKLPDERCSLEARHDGIGHVLITATLLPLNYQLDWQVSGTLIFEAGQLDGLVSVVANGWGS